MFLYLLIVYILMCVVFKREYKTMRSAGESAKKSIMKGVTETVGQGITSQISGEKK